MVLGMKCIIFDCDGVLVDSEVIYKTSELLFLKNVGLEYDPKDFMKRFMGRSESHFFEMIDSDHRTKHGRPLPPDFYDNLKAFEREQFKTTLKAVTGIENLLRQTSHIPRAVASSSSVEMLDLKLGKTGLQKIFEGRIFSAEMVTRGKPFPDLFLYTAEKLDVSPQDCMVIEDSSNGILAARAAGMTAIGFCGGGHCLEGHDQTLSDAGAHYICQTSADLEVLINQMVTPEPDARLSLA